MSTKTRTTAMGNMRGHMALNSSPYKTSVNKLSSQYLIQDQMASHYYNLATIKSAIDSRPPKSTQQSVRKRDQMRRDALLHGKKLPPQKSPRQLEQGGANGKHNAVENRNNYTDTAVSYSDVYMDYHDQGHNRTSRSWAPERNIPQSSRSRPATTGHSAVTGKYRDRNNETTLRPKSSKPNVLDVTYSGDYLDKHSDRFHSNGEKAFTPRTKKRPGKSFLSQSKHYCAPPSKGKNKRSPRQNPDKEEGNMTEGNLKEYEIPHLEIERDGDHRRWIEEQSEFVQRLSLLDRGGRLKPTASSSFGGKSSTMERVEREEEELKYLEFINDVTNDILSRGIYSDRVLEQVMERHVQRRRRDLDVGRMRRLLQKLKSDLGMDVEDSGMLGTTSYEYNSFASEKLKRDIDTLKRQPETSSGLLHEDADSLSDISYTQIDHRPKSGGKRSIVNKLKESRPKNKEKVSERVESLKDDVFVPSKHSSKPPSETTFGNEPIMDQHIDDDALLSPKLDDQELLQKLNDLELKQNQSTDESDYESVAALSMVLKPETQQKHKKVEPEKQKKVEPEVKKPTSSGTITPEVIPSDDVDAKVSHNEEDVAYSDDFNEENEDLTDDEF